MKKGSIFLLFVVGSLVSSATFASINSGVKPVNQQSIMLPTGKPLKILEIQYIAGNSRMDLIVENAIIFKIKTDSGKEGEQLFADLTDGPESTWRISSIVTNLADVIVTTREHTFYYLHRSLLDRAIWDNEKGKFGPFKNDFFSEKQLPELSTCFANALSFRRYVEKNSQKDIRLSAWYGAYPKR